MIVRRETPLALYKGLGAVLMGIVPKMAIRFASFEKYKAWLADRDTGKTNVGNIFLGEWTVQCVKMGEADQSRLCSYLSVPCPLSRSRGRCHHQLNASPRVSAALTPHALVFGICVRIWAWTRLCFFPHPHRLFPR